MAGWQAREMGIPFRSSAFEPSSLNPFQPNVFCQPEEGTQIMIETLPGPNDLTMIRLRLFTGEDRLACRADREADRIPNYNFWPNIPVPNLQAPSETTALISGGSRSINHISSPVYLQTRLTAKALASHYAEQMHQAGWTQRTATQSEGSSVSLWRIETDAGNVWEGLLSFIAQSEPGYWVGSFTAISDEQTDP